jgi:AraC-like DNA-binding protein
MDKNIIENIIFINCDKEKIYEGEQIIPELALTYIVSGRKERTFSNQKSIGNAGEISLTRKNVLLKSMIMSDENGHSYKSVTILLTINMLKQYAAKNNIAPQSRYFGKSFIDLTKSKFIQAYFNSFLPYFEYPEKLTGKIIELKTDEAIELLLACNDDLKQMIFDLSEPHKIDLENYMNRNFIFNIPLKDFARLTGRSLSTFKRDFKTIYNSPPEKWLKEKRLDEAKFLIKEQGQKPSEVYYAVGFESFPHFSVSFKERFGVNPSTI